MPSIGDLFSLEVKAPNYLDTAMAVRRSEHGPLAAECFEELREATEELPGAMGCWEAQRCLVGEPEPWTYRVCVHALAADYRVLERRSKAKAHRVGPEGWRSKRVAIAGLNSGFEYEVLVSGTPLEGLRAKPVLVAGPPEGVRAKPVSIAGPPEGLRAKPVLIAGPPEGA